jgi:hypothetical protein
MSKRKEKRDRVNQRWDALQTKIELGDDVIDEIKRLQNIIYK